MAAQHDDAPGWIFLDEAGAFRLENPDQTSYLYFPLVNGAGLMASISPSLHGDLKLDQNTFLLAPVSVEDLHNTRSARNFWVYVEGKGAWSATGNAAAQSARRFDPENREKVSLEAGLLWHRVTRENAAFGLRATLTNIVPSTDDPVELLKVTLTNLTDQPLRLTPTAAVPIYGRSADNLRDHRHVTSLLHRIRTHPYGVLVKPTLSFDERGHTLNKVTYGVLGVEADGTAPREFIPVLEDFVGEGGTLDNPEAIMRPGVSGCAAGQQIAGYEAMGALRFKPITLQPGQSCAYVLILAILPDSREPDGLIERYGSAIKFEAALTQTQAFWHEQVDALHFRTGDADFDRWMKWVTLQPVLRRLYGNSFLPYHDYGRGGRGWRDLWQDCLALLLTEADGVPELLFSNWGGVRFDGSNATIIGQHPGEFVADRNNIPRVWMDHGAWPFQTTKLYIDQSGDLAFLLREQSYFKDPQIKRCRARDATWTPEQGTQLRTASGEIYQGTVLEHMLVQHLTAFFNVGEHNILKLEGADWNDGMDMARQRGESVAFTAFYASNLSELGQMVLALEARGVTEVALAWELLPFLDTLVAWVDYDNAQMKQTYLEAIFNTYQPTLSGKKARVTTRDLARDLERKSAWLFDHLRQHEWLTNREGQGWFNGYYDDDGGRVEGDHPNGVRMTLTGQVFALMGGIATDEQARAIIKAADRYLLEPSMGGYRLNTDFGDIQLNLGRCFGFALGHKENGAMFSHMTVMYANALYQRGFVREAYQTLAGIYAHCRDFAKSRMYPGIPEYINPRGRGMYTYLTGSASWLLLTLVTESFGVKGQLGDLILAPKLVTEQFDSEGKAALITQFAGKRLEVTYHNPSRLDYGQYLIRKIAVNGTPLDLTSLDVGALIPRLVIEALAAAQPVHRIEVELGA